ncbi:hypothetical protein M2139_002124 [Enterococcus sp. PF1-24]|uniref:hypothetical protein n=1 Tax=unclassified Enterococcus TaxID=2608891 RepID=UPI0024759160|nr:MULTISPECIES: hypothetical protein [unclassified Enterococcus]MDH6365123.1 hypothetical protein [Enterococcus sp. PFB1-1]MDH6402224.1 hypothetical protein [Enterococcus sp. PF1-24]
MVPNDLLVDTDRYQLYILQTLEIRKSVFCSVDYLCQFLDISKYKVERNLEALQDSFLQIDETASIRIEPTGEITLEGISNLLLKKVRLLFLERSPYYQIFHNLITYEIGIESQLEFLPVSRSNAYKYQKEIKILLDEEKLNITRNKITGSEFQLRNFLFNFYYEVFNGIRNPFTTEIKAISNRVIEFLKQSHNVTISKTVEYKLMFFINIWLTRVKYTHFINESYMQVQESNLKEYLERLLKENFSLSQQDCEKEIAYFYLFLGLEEIVLFSDDDYQVSESENTAKEITTNFLHQLVKQMHNISPEQYQLLVDGLMRINRRWLVYHFRESSFIHKIQNKYFQEVNPQFEKLVRTYIESLDEHLFNSNQEKNKLYYDYLFFLITKIPVEQLEVPIYVCIDFSHGKSYNEYIKMMLYTLKSMHIVYEENISSKTQLYLSDFAIDKLKCEQMIWKRPPTPDDWEEFGQLMLQVKGN